MIRRALLGITAALGLLGSAQADGKFASITCYFQTNEHFTVIGTKERAIIQWNDGGYNEATVAWEDPWLFVAQSADGNMFKMAYNAKTKEAFGETTFKDGKKSGGPLWCSFK